MPILSQRIIKIDHSGGHAFLDKGMIYYSPNCTRAVAVPPYKSFHQRYPFLGQHNSLEAHMQPAWWQTGAGYLSFVPLIPVLDNFIFRCLKSAEIIDFGAPTGHRLWKLNPESCNEWHLLQDRLILASENLRNLHQGLPCIRPQPPSMIGFEKEFLVKKTASETILRAREWFVMWIAYLSFSLVVAGEWGKDHWFSSLVDKKIEQAWIVDLLDITLNSFTTGRKTTPRVGTFVDPFSRDKFQPTVPWFCDLGIPVWYRWGPKEEDQLRSISVVADSSEYLRPPAELLQLATTHLVKSPCPPSDAQESAENITSQQQQALPTPPPPSNERPLHSLELLYQTRDAHIKTKPWKAFFGARENANGKYYQNETQQQREKRLNRERCPPKASAEVFLWDWGEDDPLCLVRTRVLKRERNGVLADKKYLQSYDSIRNQWDLCRYFDFGTPAVNDDNDNESDDEVDKAFEDMEPLELPIDEQVDQHEEAEKQVNSYISSRLHSYSSRQPTLTLTFEPQNEIIDEWVQVSFTPIRYLSIHFGYTPPLPLPQGSNVAVDKWRLLLKNTGLRTDRTTDLPLSGYGDSIIELLEQLLLPSSAHRPLADFFDLHPSNRCSISSSKLRDMIPRQDKDLFIVNTRCFATEPHFGFTVAVFNPNDAVKVFRLLQEPKITPFLLAQYLLQDGIAFRTLLPVTHIPSLSLVSSVSLPIRLQNHRFTPIDYEAYVQQRAKIFSSLRGRAALLRGGIVARLAREHIDLDDTALGPSTVVTLHNIGYHVTTPDGKIYMDDSLTEEEIQLICGLYKCHNDNGQIALLSWWPLPHVWNNESNGHYWGHWTDIDEQWFQKRQNRILQGLEQPRQPNSWRSALRGTTSWRVTTRRLREEAAALYT